MTRRSRLAFPLILAAIPGLCGSIALAERRGVGGLDWLHQHSETGEFGCLHCRLGVLSSMGLLEAGDELRYDPATGRDRRNFPPDRRVDFHTMALDIDIPDMNTPKFRAEQTLKFTPLGTALDSLELNAQQLMIESVCLPHDPNCTATHAHDDKKLTIRFDPPLPPGKENELQIIYSVNDPPDGLAWTPESAEWKGRPAQLHTQGQPETNRFWFPSHDFPNERLNTEITVTVPKGYTASANGRLESQKTEGDRTTFHFVQDKDHVNYLVSMIVGKFDIKDIAPEGSKLPMPVYVPPGKGELIQQTYGRTPRMIETFERRFSEPYPWDKYAQLVVWNFGAGGMENTSATTMYDTAILDEKALQDEDLDGLISHELAHQWFGDLITCKSWEHIWLNEGWATYSTALWFEDRDGYDAGYLRSVYGSLRGVAASDQIGRDDASWRPGMVSNVYKHPWETFRRLSNPYPKGASILHMLRMKLGEELFFKGVGVYVDRFKHGSAETDDFRKVLEEVSGLSLEQFFEQWCERPGTPKVAAKAEWDHKRNELRISVEQMQRIDAEKPAFVFDLPVIIRPNADSAGAGGESRTIVMSIDSRRHEQTLALPAEPSFVEFDPGLSVLMDLKMDVPTDWLVRQASQGSSLPSRLDSAKHLGSRPGDRATAALRDIALNEKELYPVRQRAAESLGSLGATSTLLECLSANIKDARVRRSTISALASAGGEGAFDALAARAADTNESYACRAAALEGIGKLEGMQPASDQPSRAFPILSAALSAESQHDQVRRGALSGLAQLGRKEGLDAAIPYTRFGTLNRTRPAAIDAVGRLSKHDPERAYSAVAPLLDDRENRARDAAAAALVEIKEKRGLDALDRAISASRDDVFRERAAQWRSLLAARLAKEDSIDATKADLDKLKAEVEKLKKQVEEREKQ